MRHAIRRLSEELRDLAEAEQMLVDDPIAAAGNASLARAMLAEVRCEITEVRTALEVLDEATRLNAARASSRRLVSVRTPRGRRLAPDLGSPAHA